MMQPDSEPQDRSVMSTGNFTSHLATFSCIFDVTFCIRVYTSYNPRYCSFVRNLKTAEREVPFLSVSINVFHDKDNFG